MDDKHPPDSPNRRNRSSSGSKSGKMAFIEEVHGRDPTAAEIVLQSHPIAFAPENARIPPEMINLEEKLETTYRQASETILSNRMNSLVRSNIRASAEETQPQPPPFSIPPKLPKREASNDDLIATESLISLVLTPSQQIHHGFMKPPTQGDKSGTKGPVTGKRTSSEKPTRLPYGFLPRPYMKHMVDIEKRRVEKIAEIQNGTTEHIDFSLMDLRVKTSPSGLLVFHVLEVHHLHINSTTFVKNMPISFYCVIAMGPTKRCSKIVHANSARRIRIDHQVHLSIEISEWRENPANRLLVEVWSYQDPENHYIVGVMEMHVFEFIRKEHSVELHRLWSDGIKVGQISVEYAFSYGYFGYGHSNLLRNPNSLIMESVSHSMYPRIRMSGKDISDKVYKVRMPARLKIFKYNSLVLEDPGIKMHEIKPPTWTQSQYGFRNSATEDKQGIRAVNDFLEPKPMIVQQVKFDEDNKPIHCKLHMNIWQREIQADFNDVYGEFICMGTRKTRLDYLSNLVQGRMKDIRETEAGWLFKSFNEREPERIEQTELKLGQLIFPPKIPCPEETYAMDLKPGDEDFLDKFPSVKREPGYLASMFGYQKKPESSEFLNDMDYPAYKNAYDADKNPRKNRRSRRSRCRNFFTWLWAILIWMWNFVFPEIKLNPEVPELSVTLPTPEGSTTNVFTYFVRDAKDAGVTSKQEKLQAQAAALTLMTEKPWHDYFDQSDDGESSSTDDDSNKNAKVKRSTSSPRIRRMSRRESNENETRPSVLGQDLIHKLRAQNRRMSMSIAQRER